MRSSRLRALTALAYPCLLLAGVTYVYSRIPGPAVPQWATLCVYGLALSWGLLLGVAAYRDQGERWTRGTAAAAVGVGVATVAVGHLLDVFSSGYHSLLLLKAAGVILAGPGLWKLTGAEELSAIRDRWSGALALTATGVGVALVATPLGRSLVFLWAVGIGYWLAPLAILVGVRVRRRADGLRATAIAVAVVGAVTLLVLAPLLGEKLATLAACWGAQWGTFEYLVDWSTLRFGWDHGCNWHSSQPSVDHAVIGGALLAVGLAGERVAARWT